MFRVNRPSRPPALATLAASTVLIVAACSSGSTTTASGDFKLVTPGVLTVALTDGNLPQITSRDDRLIGMDAYWINKFAAKHDLKVKPVPSTFTAMLQGVQTGKYDVGTTTYWAPERAKNVYYTLPDFTAPLGILSKKDSNYSDPSSLKHQKVGTLAGYNFISNMGKYYGSGNVQTFSTIASGLKALQSGLIKGWVDGYRRVSGNFRYSKQFPDIVGHKLSPKAFGLPKYIIDASSYNFVKCDNAGLAKAMNVVQRRLLKSGAYTEHAKEYTPQAKAATPANKVPQQGCGA